MRSTGLKRMKHLLQMLRIWLLCCSGKILWRDWEQVWGNVFNFANMLEIASTLNTMRFLFAFFVCFALPRKHLSMCATWWQLIIARVHFAGLVCFFADSEQQYSRVTYFNNMGFVILHHSHEACIVSPYLVSINKTEVSLEGSVSSARNCYPHRNKGLLNNLNVEVVR